MNISTIAQLSGVSKATVSRVINNSGYVSERTRKKVEEIILQQGYEPSLQAINLSRQSTKSIGVIIPEISNTFLNEILYGITEIARKLDYSLIFCDTGNSVESEENAISMMIKQRVSGILITSTTGFLSTNIEKKLSAMKSKLNIPVIAVDREFVNKSEDGVLYENFNSTYLATTELIKVGHKNIAIITGDLNLSLAKLRLDGYKQALKDNGIDREYILEGDFTIEKAYQLSDKTLKNNIHVTAFITSNNDTSLGFLRACNHNNKKIGEDISIIGIDHLPELDAIDFPFSCVSRDSIGMGRAAMELFVERLEKPLADKKLVLIPCDLRLKGSEKYKGFNEA